MIARSRDLEIQIKWQWNMTKVQALLIIISTTGPEKRAKDQAAWA